MIIKSVQRVQTDDIDPPKGQYEAYASKGVITFPCPGCKTAEYKITLSEYVKDGFYIVTVKTGGKISIKPDQRALPRA